MEMENGKEKDLRKREKRKNENEEEEEEQKKGFPRSGKGQAMITRHKRRTWAPPRNRS